MVLTLEPTKLLPRLHHYNYDRWLTPGYEFRPHLVEDVILLGQECPYTMDTEISRAGDPFQFLDWQIYDLLVPVFGIVHSATGMRRFRRVIFFVPRKNGKSGLTSVLMIYLLGFDGETRPKLYSIAKNRDQAGIVYEEAALMIEGSSFLKPMFTTYNSKNDKRILCHSNKGEWKVLSHDSKDKDGLNMHGMSADEIQQYDKSDAQVVKLLHTSTSTRRQSLELLFGTAGVESGDIPFWKQRYDEAKKIYDNPELDPSLFPLIYEAPKGANIYERKTWFIANPSLGLVKTIAYMEREAANAQLNPMDEGEFKRLELNVSTSSSESWIPLDKWKAAAEPEKTKRENLLRRPCFVGVDLSATRDFTAMSLAFPPHELDPYWRFIVELWLPETTLKRRQDIEKRDYMRWLNEGWYRKTLGDVIDKEELYEQLVLLYPDYDIKGVAFDPWDNKAFEREVCKKADRMFEKEPDPNEVVAFWKREREVEDKLFVEWRQGYVSMSGPTKEFEKRVFWGADNKPGGIKHNGNPIMDFMVDCVVISKDPAGNKKPDKEKSTNKIDGVVASIMALGLGLLRAPQKSLDQQIAEATEIF